MIKKQIIIRNVKRAAKPLVSPDNETPYQNNGADRFTFFNFQHEEQEDENFEGQKIDEQFEEQSPSKTMTYQVKLTKANDLKDKQ